MEIDNMVLTYMIMIISKTYKINDKYILLDIFYENILQIYKEYMELYNDTSKNIIESIENYIEKRYNHIEMLLKESEEI